VIALHCCESPRVEGTGRHTRPASRLGEINEGGLPFGSTRFHFTRAPSPLLFGLSCVEQGQSLQRWRIVLSHRSRRREIRLAGLEVAGSMGGRGRGLAQPYESWAGDDCARRLVRICRAEF
jgi:hypothetical protein